MISILVTSRVQGNINHGLEKLLDSIATKSWRPQDVEVLIKFDDDDTESLAVKDQITNTIYPFHLLFVNGPRERGYIDIHKGYNQLLWHANPETKVIGAMADDFTVEPEWDLAILETVKGAGDYFIIHQRPHPPNNIKERHDAEENKFFMGYDMFDAEDLHVIDEAPFWSPALLSAVSPFKSTNAFPISFTDAWTLCLEYVLWTDHQINITKFLPKVLINRTTCEIDQPGNERWHTDRRINFDKIKSKQFRKYVMDQANGVACQV